MQLPVGVVVVLLSVAGLLLRRIRFCMVVHGCGGGQGQRWPLGHGPRAADLVRLPYGMVMAAGALMAMGGVDSRLLRFLPGGSPHGWGAVPAMLVGILIGLRCPAPLRLPRR